MTKTYKEWVRYFLDNGAGLKLAENLARHYVELQNKRLKSNSHFV